MNKMFVAIVALLVLSASLLTMNVAQPVKAVNCSPDHFETNKDAQVRGNAGCLTGNTGNTGDGTDCVKYNDYQYVVVIDLSCNTNTNMIKVSEFVAQGYEIKATVGLNMILTK
jgi:hypothetical protein